MKIGEIRKRLVRIGAAAKSGDYDAAHGEERGLFIDVLRAVASGEAGSGEARAALTSLELEFPRRTT